MLYIIAAPGDIIWILIWLLVSNIPPRTEAYDKYLWHERQGIGFCHSLIKSLANSYNWIAGLYTKPSYAYDYLWLTLNSNHHNYD